MNTVDPSQRDYSWEEMANLTHETQVETFGWCACEDDAPMYDDCPKNMNDTKLRRHSLVTIEGQPCQLTEEPIRTIVGTWLLFYRTEVGGRVESCHATDEELAEMTTRPHDHTQAGAGS